MAWTMVVFFTMFITRMRYFKRANFDVSKLTRTSVGFNDVPEEISWPADNFKNLFELPVLFYAMCAYLSIIGSDTVYVNLAWGYVFFRVIHSIVQCSYNKVIHRFYTFFASSVLLVVMLLRLVIKIMF